MQVLLSPFSPWRLIHPIRDSLKDGVPDPEAFRSVGIRQGLAVDRTTFHRVDLLVLA